MRRGDRIQLRTWIEQSIARKLAIVLLITITTVISVSGMFIYSQNKNILVNNTQTALVTINFSIAHQLNDLLKENEVLVKRMASNQSLVEFLETVKTRNEINSNPAYAQINNFLEQIHQTNSSISAVWFASEEGSYFILNNNVISLPDYDIKTRPWHEKALNSDDIYITDPYIDVVTGKLAIDILNKVIVEDKVIGFTAVSNPLMEQEQRQRIQLIWSQLS